MPTLTVTKDTSTMPPSFRLQTSGFSGTTVRIIRTNTDGSSYTVRTVNPGQLATAAWYDYESPWQQAGTYVATTDTGDTAAATAAAMGIMTPWLVHVGIPALSMPVTLEDVGERARAVNQGVHKVLGRANPVVITDGVRSGPTFDMVVRTATVAERAALAKLLATASPLLLQVAYPGNPRVLYHYVAVGDVTESDKVNFSSTYITWTLPCTVVDAPSGLQQAAWTCAGVLATYTTAETVRQRFASCTALLINSPTAA